MRHTSLCVPFLPSLCPSLVKVHSHLFLSRQLRFFVFFLLFSLSSDGKWHVIVVDRAAVKKSFAWPGLIDQLFQVEGHVVSEPLSQKVCANSLEWIGNKHCTLLPAQGHFVGWMSICRRFHEPGILPQACFNDQFPVRSETHSHSLAWTVSRVITRLSVCHLDRYAYRTFIQSLHTQFSSMKQKFGFCPSCFGWR